MNGIDAYFAGLFDGEGCIQIRKNKPGKNGRQVFYQICVTIAMIDRRPLELLAGRFGGRIYNSAVTKLTLSPAFQWVVVSRTAKLFLERMQPYSKVKREEIDVALKCQEDITRKKGGGKRTDAATLAFRESCRLELQALKRRFRFHP